jgi:hypothetical protein
MREKLMIRQAKKIIKNIKSEDLNGVVSELLHNSHYFNEPKHFYKVFNWQGGTIWQLAGQILNDKKARA